MLITFARSIILYLIVLIVMRIMGKREIGQLEPFEFVISIMIADLASIPMADIGIPIFIIGIYTSLILLFCIFGNYLGSIASKGKYKLILNINPILSGICILFIGIINNSFGILFILLIYIFSESFDNIMLSELHNNISSNSRVTVESINQCVLAIFGLIFSILMTILLKYISIHSMYIVIGIIIIVFSLFNILKLKLMSR